MNQIPSQFADNLPFVQQATIENLHNWGLKVTPDKDGGTDCAFTITPLPLGEDWVPHVEQTLSEAI
jgi:hypothetical protein